MICYTCPSPDRWTAMLGDDLPADEQLDLQCHLEECPDCQRTLEACAADRDSWIALPRFLASGQQNDTMLRTVIDRLKLEPEQRESCDSTDMTLEFLDPSDRPGSLGRLGSYEVIEEIGRGGMGVVLKALDPAFHRVVAIKVLAPQLAVSGSARKRFTREARAAAAVCHEHVVTIHAVEEFKGLPYLVMHYVAGQSLQQKLTAKGPLPVADILRIGMQAAAGLSAAHAQGLVHRDVKPANILLENGVERVRLSDFGLARAIDDAAVTQSGVITGTPQYMAPEQARGEPLDHRADLFSLGSVLYALCTGKAPFRGANPLDVLRKVNEENPPPIRQQNPEVPAWLEAIVAKLMAKNPINRFASAAEVSELLERCLAHVQNPTAAPLPTVAGHVPPRRRPRLAYAAVIAAGLFVVSEATGFTRIVQMAATVLRLRTPDGTLVVEIDDPAIKVALDEKDLVITGAGTQEIRLKPGSYTVRAMKGEQTKSEIVSVTQNGRVTVRVSFEAGVPKPPPAGLVRTTQVDGRNGVLAAEAPVAAFSSDRGRPAVVIWDIATGKQRARVELVLPTGYSQEFKAPSVLAISGDGKFVAAALSNMLFVWDVETGKELMSPPGYAGEISTIAFGVHGEFIATAGKNLNQVQVLDVASGRQHRHFVGFSPPPAFLTLSPDGSKLLTNSGTGVRLFDIASGEEVGFRLEPGRFLRGGAFLPKSVTEQGEQTVLVMEHGFQTWRVRGASQLFWTKEPICAFATTRDERGILTGGKSGSVRLWDLATGRLVSSFALSGPARALSAAPDGKSFTAIIEGETGAQIVTYTADLSLPPPIPPGVKR